MGSEENDWISTIMCFTDQRKEMQAVKHDSFRNQETVNLSRTLVEERAARVEAEQKAYKLRFENQQLHEDIAMLQRELEEERIIRTQAQENLERMLSLRTTDSDEIANLKQLLHEERAAKEAAQHHVRDARMGSPRPSYLANNFMSALEKLELREDKSRPQTHRSSKDDDMPEALRTTVSPRTTDGHLENSAGDNTAESTVHNGAAWQAPQDHSQYMANGTPQGTQDRVAGIGVLLGQVDREKGRLYHVMQMQPKGSAAESGLVQTKDICYAIDGTDISDMKLDAVLSLLRGPDAKPVTLDIGRMYGGEEIRYSIILKRKVIPPPATIAEPNVQHAVSRSHVQAVREGARDPRTKLDFSDVHLAPS